MQATASKLEGSRVRLDVEVGPEDLQREYARAIRRVSGRVSIPGFRRGKAPRPIVESYVGAEAVMREMVEHVVPRAYTDAVEQTGVEPLDQPELDLPDVPSLDAPLVFSAEVAVAPEVELGDVSALEVEAEMPEVSDEDVETQVAELQEMRTTWDPVERPSQLEDVVGVEISINAAGVPESEPQVYSVRLGQNGFPAEFDQELTGKSAGDEFAFESEIPLDDPNPDLRGQRVTFSGAVQSVSEARLPDLDDAFAQTMAGLDSMDALRGDIRERLLEQRRLAAQAKLEDDVLDALVEASTFEVPAVLVEQEHGALLERETQAMVSRGIAVDTYLGSIGQTRAEWEENWREQAELRVNRGIVLEHYADAEEIQADDDEVAEETDRVAASYPEARRDTVRRSLARDEGRARIESAVRNRKALAKLVEAVTGQAGPAHDHQSAHEPDPDVAAVADAAAAEAEPSEAAESESATP
ncbi:MAG: trigger factor [Chloroflexi bacterium]|nr:trigger factor [Chloroflexota bacterium]